MGPGYEDKEQGLAQRLKTDRVDRVFVHGWAFDVYVGEGGSVRKFIMRYKNIIVCLVLVAVSFVLAGTIFQGSFHAFAYSCRALWQSLVAYFQLLSGAGVSVPQPIAPADESASKFIPPDIRALGAKFKAFGRLLISGENFEAYFASIQIWLFALLVFLPVIILFAFILRILLRRAIRKMNNNYNHDTIALRAFKRLSNALYEPIKRFTLAATDGLGDFVNGTIFRKVFIIIWLFNLNVFSILVSLIAALLYFSASFDFVTIYNFLYLAVAFILTTLRVFPTWFWVIAGLVLINWLRKRIGLRRLRIMEARNVAFDNDRSLAVMLCGTMGKDKTKLMTDMALSLDVQFRAEAHKRMLEIDLKFPSFPWIVFENDLKGAIANGQVYNLASCGRWGCERDAEFHKAFYKAYKRGIMDAQLSRLGSPNFMWAYDFEKYGWFYDDKKTIIGLQTALVDYAKLYLIYITESCLVLSNYGIRTDAVKEDAGNFPRWDGDFFDRRTRDLWGISRRAHILDYDMIRLGKKVLEGNRFANAYEFGVVACTEFGKERGNQFKNQEIKDTIKRLQDTVKELEKAKADATAPRARLLELTERANQLNDKLNDELKVIRHHSTIGGFPFSKVLVDDQRPESLGADARDLFEIIHIDDKSEERLAMPFFFIEELINAFIFPRFGGVYDKYRYCRGDNTLLMYLFKKLGSRIERHRERTYNRFGYYVRNLIVEASGGTGEKTKPKPYYLMYKKIYADRYSTDAYNDIFATRLATCGVGLDDMPCYAATKATIAELKSQNSYFIADITSPPNSTPRPPDLPLIPARAYKAAPPAPQALPPITNPRQELTWD